MFKVDVLFNDCDGDRPEIVFGRREVVVCDGPTPMDRIRESVLRDHPRATDIRVDPAMLVGSGEDRIVDDGGDGG